MRNINGTNVPMIMRSKRARIVTGLLAGLIAISTGSLQAAPGSLSQLPLFLAAPVQPNIFFLLDDSGSMDWEVLKSVGAIAVYGSGSNSGNVDFDPGTDTTNNLELCAGYNVMAYDPNVTYTPWYGVNSSGIAFQDQSVTEAMVNPYTGHTNTYSCDNNGVVNNGNGRACNLLTDFNDYEVAGEAGAFYYPWNDDGDGVFEAGECSTNPADRVYVQDMSAAQQTNYANWFSYYRKREYVMKRAVSQIADESTDRMGFATINRNNHITKGTAVGTQVKDIDDLSLPVNATAVANKATLLDNLLGIDASSRTPLRQGLEHVGQYFENQMNSDALFGYTPVNQSDSAAGHSPILSADLGGTCQQNFAIVMSDGYWNGSDPTTANADGDGSTTFDGQSYGDNWSHTLADVAMQYYEGDLLSIANNVPVVNIDVMAGDKTECDAVTSSTAYMHPNCYDTNQQQHLVTYTVAFGVTGTIPEHDASNAECLPNTRASTMVSQNWPTSCDSTKTAGWPQPAADSETAIDDMQHAAWNGRGKFLSAKNPTDLINSLRDAINDIASKNPVAAAAVSIDTFNIISGGNVVQAKFDSSYWSGELYSYALVVSGSTTSVSATPNWQAHTLLDARDYTTRTIVTYNGTQAIPLSFPVDYYNSTLGTSDLSQAQINDLLHDAPYAIATTNTTEQAANQTYGVNLVAYLKGDHTNEGRTDGKFRERGGHRLGDIVHSSPIYVGDPDASLYPDASYQSWANNTSVGGGVKGRTPMVYVGANDGMLHAFNAETGVEVFAFIPKAVFSDVARGGLHWLANRAYDHVYYVDGDITVANVYADIDNSGTEAWHTILIGALGGGGRSIFAIDITNPSEFSTLAGVESNILWEFSNDELGYTYGKPTIAKLNNGHWAAIFGNGYIPGTTSTGQASLFIKYLDSPTAYKLITTNVGSNAASDCLNSVSDCNGLSTPAVVDLGGDKVADRVYAGDIQGNMWAFDISSALDTAWVLAYGTNPLFQAKSSTDVAQPITGQPSVILHPTERHSNTSPNTIVFFGTGQYVAENDPSSTGENSFYGIWDNGSAITVARDSVLVEQTVNQDVLAAKQVRLLSNHPVDYTTKRGWYFDLPDTGERMISFPIVFGNNITYTTIIPESNLCSASGGTSWLMVHNLLDGSEPDFIAIDVNQDGIFDSDDQVGDKNVGGVKSGTLWWQMSPAKSGAGSEISTFIPAADLDIYKMRGSRSVGTRSSWGRFRME